MRTLDSEKLFEYAFQFCKDSIANGNGSDYPTFREVARKFKVKQETVQDAIDDFHTRDSRYMDTIVGIRTFSGIGCFGKIGDYKVEAWDDSVDMEQFVVN